MENKTVFVPNIMDLLTEKPGLFDKLYKLYKLYGAFGWNLDGDVVTLTKIEIANKTISLMRGYIIGKETNK